MAKNKQKQHEKIITIVDKESRKVYNKASPFYGNAFYRLTTKLEKNNKEEFFFAYPNIVSEEIFHTIETTSYTDKRYLFFYEKKSKRLILHNWQELGQEKPFFKDQEI